MRVLFEKGNKASHGGPRPNSGRPADWLREKCRSIVVQKDLIGFLGKVASGDSVDFTVTKDGEVVPHPAAIKDRTKATEILLDRGYGKVLQDLSLQNADGTPLTVKVVAYGNNPPS